MGSENMMAQAETVMKAPYEAPAAGSVLAAWIEDQTLIRASLPRAVNIPHQNGAL